VTNLKDRVELVGAVVGVVLLAGCGGSSTEEPADASAGDGGGSAVGDRLGTFSVQLIAPRMETDGTTTPGYTSVLGKVYDGVTPDTVVWEVAATSGGCTLSIPHVPFCATACGSTMACVADDTCAPYPAAQSVGAVHLDGVKTTAGTGVDLTAVANSYQVAGATLAYPAFAEGDAITLTASGSAFATAFTASSKGVATLALTNAGSLALVAGAPLALGWTAPASAGSTIHVKLDISHHGGSKGKIECDAGDSGALSVASSLVDQLLGLGVAGFPTIIVTRAATGYAAVATGHVDLVVASEVEVAIGVPGVQSCTSDDQCTAPATCQDDLTCR
jgi:hypothetical protein